MSDTPDAPLDIAVVGAAGRMGRMLVRAVAEAEDCRLSGATAEPGSAALGRDAGEAAGLSPLGVTIEDDPLPVFARTRAVLDFTVPAATVEHAALAAQARLVHVIGTTGFSDDDLARLDAAARHATIVRAGNMALGVNLLVALVERAVAALGPGFDVEIVEMHHRHKVDAPSGTALMLGEAAARARGTTLAERAVGAREGHTGARPDGAIGMQSLRGGDVVGEHRVVLAGEGERLELAHVATDRMLFARGALAAARWGASRGPGHYAMRDVLGL